MNTAAHPLTADRPAGRGDGEGRAPEGAAPTRDADGMAVASFLLGLPGLIVLNFVLGPAAVVLSLTALSRGTRRRGRALLGLVLGVADLLVLTGLIIADHGVIWSFG